MSVPAHPADLLFGPASPLYSLTAHSPFLERVAAGHQGEGGGDLALTAYALTRLIDRWMDRSSRPEAAELPRELEHVRAGLGDLPSAVPEGAHLHGILEALYRHPAPGLGRALLGYAAFHEQQGRLEEALEVAALAARAYGPRIDPADYVECALTAGRLNRLLARWTAALSCYEAAEVTGRERGDAVAALRGRLGRGAVARGRGNLPAAHAIAQSVREEARALDLPQVQAIACGDLAAACCELGRPVEALEADYEAFRLAQDPVERVRTLGNVGTDLVQLGWHDAARTAFTLVLRSGTRATVRLNALVELMALAAGAGDAAAFEEHHRAAAACRDQMPPSMTVDFLSKAAAARTRFGQASAAKAALPEAHSIAEAHGLHAWAFRLDRALRDLEPGDAGRTPDPPATPRDSPVARRVAAGLEEYAASSP
jgi:tetratricopeptide (TPR) repeat protein